MAASGAVQCIRHGSEGFGTSVEGGIELRKFPLSTAASRTVERVEQGYAGAEDGDNRLGREGAEGSVDSSRRSVGPAFFRKLKSIVDTFSAAVFGIR